MDIQTRKIEFIQSFLKIQNEELISNLENLLLISTIKPFKVVELKSRIAQSEEDIKNNKLKFTNNLVEKFRVIYDRNKVIE